MLDRKTLALFLAILLLGTFSYFHKLGGQSLWDDEISTIDYTGQSIREMLSDLPHRDANPPLFYIVYHYWRQVGDSEFAYRSLSALFGLIALVLSFFVARLLAGDRVALFTMLILAVHPLMVYCAQETRAHTILLSLSLGAVLFYVRLMQMARWRDLAGWVICLSLATYTHYFSFFLIMAFMIHGAVMTLITLRRSKSFSEPLLRLSVLATASDAPRMQAEASIWLATAYESVKMAWRRIGQLALGLVMIAVLYLPWIKSLMLQVVRGQSWRPYQPPWEIFREILIYLTVGHSATRLPGFLPPLEGMQDGTPQQVATFTLVLILMLIPQLLLLIAGIFLYKDHDNAGRTGRTGRTGRWLVLIWAFVPTAVIMIVTQKMHLFDYRHMLPFLPPMVILAAVALDRLWRKSTLLALVVGTYVLALPVLSLAQYYDDPAFAKQDWRGAYQLIKQKSKPGDAILTYHPKKALGLVYYSDGSLPIRYVVPEQGYTQNTIQQEKDAMARRVESVMAEHPRIWLVDYHGLVFDRVDVTRKTLRQSFTLAFERAFMKGPRRYTIQLYTSDFAEAAAGFTGFVDFTADVQEHSPGQILEGWHQQARKSRWMDRRGQVLLMNDRSARRIKASFYAYYPFLGRQPFEVVLEVEGQTVGRVIVNAEGVFEIEAELPEKLKSLPFLKVALESERWFRPKDFMNVTDTTNKSLLVQRIALTD